MRTFRSDPSRSATLSSVVILVADGARPDTLAEAIARGDLPAMASLAREGSLSTIAAAFPSVTGVGYAPFLLGRYPGAVGLPGLRWFDRTRGARTYFGSSRSYVGPEIRLVDSDLYANAPTIFELAPSSLGALSVIRRGLPRAHRMGQGLSFAVRTAITHFRGDIPGWLAIDRAMSANLVRRLRTQQPAFTFAAFLGVDKTSHARGHASPSVVDALRIVDDCAAEIRRDAERDGRWEEMHLWIVSDHGHSPVRSHDDLATWARGLGLTTRAHPWIMGRGTDIAVMPSGNAMAHLYLELARRSRPMWGELAPRWEPVVEALMTRPSVDLIILTHSPTEFEVRSPRAGSARIVRRGDLYSYLPVSGDPLGTEAVEDVCADRALEATLSSDYPDGIVQIASLAGSSRSGEIIVSARRSWDFRAHYEPIPHVSSHGALHREHMLVPLLTNRPTSRRPRRTVDVMASALRALDLRMPAKLDGASFV
ncbi:MAG: alkaline phosphatase family protein [Gemmatimonadaceae bacterium]